MEVNGEVWLWRGGGKASWYFLRIEGTAAAEIALASLDAPRGFGSVRVTATLGSTRWQTSVFRDSRGGGYLLPLKAQVRQAESIEDGDMISVTLEL